MAAGDNNGRSGSASERSISENIDLKLSGLIFDGLAFGVGLSLAMFMFGGKRDYKAEKIHAHKHQLSDQLNPPFLSQQKSNNVTTDDDGGGGGSKVVVHKHQLSNDTLDKLGASSFKGRKRLLQLPNNVVVIKHEISDDTLEKLKLITSAAAAAAKSSPSSQCPVVTAGRYFPAIASGSSGNQGTMGKFSGAVSSTFQGQTVPVPCKLIQDIHFQYLRDGGGCRDPQMCSKLADLAAECRRHQP